MNAGTKGRAGAGLLAAGILTIAAGLGITSATASGESTTVTLTSPTTGTDTTFIWSYDFQANGGHELSNIAVRFCNTSLLDHVVSASPGGEVFKDGDPPGGHAGFGAGIKFEVGPGGLTGPTGNLSVTFDQPYGFGPNGIYVQSHSGDGQDPDATTQGVGPDACAGTTTTQPTVTVPEPTTTTAPATTTTAPATTTTIKTTTTTAPATTTTTVQSTTTTAPATTTTTRRVTTTFPPGSVPTTVPPTTAPPTTAPPTTAPPTTDPPTTAAAPTTIPASVLGVVERNTLPAQVSAGLAKTGSSSLPLLVGLGLALSIVGLGLLVGEWVGRPAD